VLIGPTVEPWRLVFMHMRDWKPILLFSVSFFFFFTGVAQAAAPTISNLSPPSGAVGASVTITGTNFGSTQGTSTVKFNGTSAGATSWSATSIVATVPSGATTGNVVVTVSNRASNGVSFTVVPAPSITSLSPTSGAVGASVTITGANFGTSQGTSTVKFNGTTATPTSWSAGSIVGPVPSGATTGNVVVHASGVDSNGKSFSVAPNISGLSPTGGAPGTSITISGLTFGGSQGTSTVTFNGTTASPTSWSSTSIGVPVPSGATSGPVVVTVGNLASNGVSFTVAPIISALGPTGGAPGTSVTIYGYNFNGSQGTSTVTFNGTTASPTSWSNNSIVVPVPSGATTGPIVVTVGSLASNGAAFTVAPTINSISPTAGAAGTSVTISGLNFGSSQGSSKVTFNGIAATPTTWSLTSIVPPVPSGATTGQVVVTVAGFASNGMAFTGAPAILGVSPPSASAGTTVTISGFDFGSSQGTSTVTFNGVSAAPTSWGIQTIETPVPASVTSGPVIVTVAGLPSNSFSFTVGPGITSLNPTSGAAGTSVTISGSGFGATQGSSTVTFNGVPAIPSSWGNTSIVVPAPSGATTGLVLVTVGGISSNGASFAIGPAIFALLPASGPTGSTVTISGSNFGVSQGQNTVTFNGVAASPTIWGPTRIVAAVPSGASTGSVVVTVGGQSSNGVSFSVGTGSVNGTVTRTSDGAAVSGALVEALQSNAAQASATTASDGTYSISNLNPGIYDMRVTATGYGTAILAGNNVATGGPTTVNVTLGSSGTISGTVTQADGITPFPGVTITALSGIDTAGTATSNSSGNYSISTLAAATYVVQASATGYKPQSQSNVSVTAGGTSIANFTLSGQSVITYEYDELGRLVGTVDSLSDAAGYSYDAVGNLLAISRNHSNQTSIFYFTPQSGAIGTSVTISGTGFSANPNLNTVSFNGTNATVTSATATQILATVSTGSTTGPIAITTPNGTATSSTSFTVTASNANGAPTISGFTPTIGTPGTATTISGTNFDVAANDRTRFNNAFATVTSATSTSISTTVPLTATSGRISVATSAGNAVSSSDFFVPPPGFTASSVAFTGRMTFGGAFTGTFGAAGQIGLLVFDGTVGRKVSLVGSAVTITSGSLSINNPNGTALTVAVGINPSAGYSGYLEVPTLPVTGTYTILVQTSSSGSLTLNLYDATDLQGTITPGGPSVTVTTVPGQNENLTFSGTLGQQIGINLTNGSYSSCNMTLYDPTGAIATGSSCSGATNSVAPFTLVKNGTYKMLIDPQLAASGSVTVQVTSVPPVTGTITPGGSSVTVTTALAGQDAVVTFSGTTGQRVSATVTNVTNPTAFLSLVKPDGTNQVSSIALSPSYCTPCFMDTQTLATTGTYTLWVRHSGTYVGSETLQLYNVPADATGTITIGGSPVSVATTVPGQNAGLTFSGTSGQKVSISLSSGSYSDCSVPLKNPDGSTLTYGGCAGATNFVDTATLGTTGTYTIFIDPQGAATGGVTVQLNNDSDVTGTITPGGSAVTVTTTVLGQDARLTFSGTVGQRVSATVTSVTNPTASLYLVKPDGTNQTSSILLSPSYCTPCFMDTQTLATAGTYALWVKHYSTYVGGETLQLYNVVDVTGTVTVGGSATTVTTTTPGQNAQVTFSGTSAQQVTVHITNNSIGTMTVQLLDPNNNSLTSTTSSGSFNLTTQTLAATGTYTISVDPSGISTGSVSLNVTSP